MFESLKTRISKARKKRLLGKAENLLEKLNMSVQAVDKADDSIAFLLGGKMAAVLSVDNGPLGHRIEITINFVPGILNLKTMADLSTIAYMNRCSISGVRRGAIGKVRVNLSFFIGQRLSKDNVNTGLTYISQCINVISKYLVDRAEKLDHSVWDLSMFEDLDIFLFDPRGMGEKKEFVHGGWGHYAKHIDEADLSAEHTQAVEASIPAIRACQDFEQANEVQLAEVGDLILKELAWNRQLSEEAESNSAIH